MKYVKFITKSDQWYKEGSEAFLDLDDNVLSRRITVEEFEAYKNENKEWNSGIFTGLRVCEEGFENNVAPEWIVGHERVDGEMCSFNEFDITETDEPLTFTDEKDLETFFGLDVP